MKLRTRICDLLEIDAPVIQAGMGWGKRQFRIAAENGDRVSMMSVPGGQIAGLLGERDVRPAAEIVAAMVQQAAEILQERAGWVTRDA